MAKVYARPIWPGDQRREDNTAPMTVDGLLPGQTRKIAPAPPPPPSFGAEAHQALLGIARAYNQRLKDVQRRAVSPTDGQIHSEETAFKDAIAALGNSPEAKAIDDIARVARERVADKKSKAEAVRQSLVKEFDAAAETRVSRHWDAARERLEASGGSLAEGRKLLQEADDDIKLSTLCERLPDYYRTKGIDVSPILQVEVAKKSPALAQAYEDVQQAKVDAAAIANGAATIQVSINKGLQVRPEAIVNPAKCTQPYSRATQ